MTTHVSVRPIVHIPALRISRLFDALHIPMPRPRTLITAAFLIIGLSIPVMMLFEILPLTFPLAFLGLALTTTGAVLAMIFCGEI